MREEAESGHGDNEEEELDYWGMDKAAKFHRECRETQQRGLAAFKDFGCAEG
jgi:hypothetical protein